MAVNMATLVRFGWAAVLLLCLHVIPGWAQDDAWGDEWDTAGEPAAEVNPDGTSLTDSPQAAEQAEPVPAIAPDGQKVLEYAPPTPEQDTTALAREILSRPEFQAESQVHGETWLQRLQRWLSSLPGIPTLGTPVWAIVVMLAAVLGLLAYLIVRLSWAGRLRRSNSASGNGPGKRGGATVDYLEQATLAAQERDFRQAVRYRFLSVLQHAGLPDNQLMTNRQVQRELQKRNAAVKRPLAVLITGYEDAWYGQLDCTQAAYDDVREQAEAVEQLLAQEAA